MTQFFFPSSICIYLILELYHIEINPRMPPSLEQYRKVVPTVLFGLFLATCLGLGFRPTPYPPYFEGRDYFDIAKGNYSHIEGYYAGRIFHPLVVRALASVTHLPIDWRAFTIVSAASLATLFCTLGLYYALEFRMRPWVYLSLAVTPIVVDQYRNYYWHDLFFAALLAIFFLALRANRWTSLPILFLLFVTRESTMILAFAFIVVAALRREWLLGASAIVVAAVGAKTAGALVAHALPQHNGLPVLLLDLLKIPYNFALNVCGLEFWTNTNAATITDPLKWVVNLPSWVRLGNIHQIGYCGFFVERPIKLLLLALSAFGVMPMFVALSLIGRNHELPFKKFDHSVAILYGALMFFLAALTGTNPPRYVLYAWPAFWIFGAVLLYLKFQTRDRKLAEFLVLNLLAAWTPMIVNFTSGTMMPAPASFFELSLMQMVTSVLILIALYIRTLKVMSKVELQDSPGN